MIWPPHSDPAKVLDAVADTKTRWPAGFDARATGIQLGDYFNWGLIYH